MAIVSAHRGAAKPLARDDIDEVAALFFRAFRDGRNAPPGFGDYVEAMCFDSPCYEESQASFVHRNGQGRIDAALLVVPMPISVNGRVMTGRLMGNYMTEPGSKTRGGADLVLTIRARNQNFCFTDSANHVSTDHWKAIGGHVLPIHSLDFRKVFRPASWLVARASKRLGWFAVLARALAPLLDKVIRRFRPQAIFAGAASGSTLARADFIAMAPTLLQRFAVHPVWSAVELDWLLTMAAQNTISGPLRLREIRDAKGHVSGCAVFYAQPGGTARVLNLLARKGQERAVVGEMLTHLEMLGCVAVEGMAQPYLMEALTRQPGMEFVPRGFCCISTRHAEVVDAAKRGEMYLGGLMGEDWSRLVTDFHD